MKYIKLFETTLTRLDNILSLKYPPHWIAKVKGNIFGSSVEQEDIEKALQEWDYTGECQIVDYETCEICGQPNLRYLFTIKNRLITHILKIGSECIKRFSAEDTKSIVIYDRYMNRVYDERVIIRLINKDVQSLTKDAKKLAVLENLTELYELSDDKYVSFLFDEYSNEGEFSPLQMVWLHDAFRKSGMDAEKVNPNNFNVNISNNFYLDQIYTMDSESHNVLKRYLTRDQRNRFNTRMERYKIINR
jgi:hypothetical protein